MWKISARPRAIEKDLAELKGNNSLYQCMRRIGKYNTLGRCIHREFANTLWPFSETGGGVGPVAMASGESQHTQTRKAMTNWVANKMNMFSYSTLKCLEENSTVYSAVSALTDAAGELKVNIDALEAATEKQVIDIRGFAKDKGEAEDGIDDHDP